MSKPTGERSGWAIGIAAGALYGLLTRLFFSTPGYRGGWLESIFPIMSIAFVFVMPFVLGAITVWFGRHQDTKRLRFMVLGPWTSCILMLLSALLFKWEGIICVVLLLPVFWSPRCLAASR